MKAISVSNVKKTFKLGDTHRSLKTIFVEMFKRGGPKNLQQVLTGIDLEIAKGEFFGIVGRNGSGKSTLLKILASIYQPTSGQVTINGKLIPFIELGAGFSPELTGKDNIYLGGSLLGFTKTEIDQMYQDIVDFAELAPYMDKHLKNYSSGMRVRLAFSLAIRATGDILLIDEVLAVGDDAFQKKCYDYFKSIRKTDKTVIFVSHNMKAVVDYCSRAALIEDGKIVKLGDPAEVAKAYKELFK